MSGREIDKIRTQSLLLRLKLQPQRDQKWATYANNAAKIGFKYPEGWTVQTSEAIYDTQNPPQLGQVSGIVVSPTNQNLEWTYVAWGGKGGGCSPDAEDVPFADGNTCSSKQIFSVETLPQIEGPKNRLFKDGLIITKTKYRANNDSPIYGRGKVIYQICLDPISDNELLPEVGTTMNLVFPCEFWSTGFNAKFEVKNEDAFNSDETKTAENIMRSFYAL